MEQQRALNALEPFLALSKSATSPRAAADLITQATSSPNTYVFAELLQTPSIQALRTSQDYVAHLKLLEIFAWGTYAEYTSTPNLPPLNDQQKSKLQLLSLLPICSTVLTTDESQMPTTSLSYDHLASTLSLPTDLALEHLVTVALHANLITGHMDPLHRTVRITSVAPLRDLAPNSIPAMLAALDVWDERCVAALADIDTRITAIKEKSRLDAVRRERHKDAFEEALVKADEKDMTLGNGPAGGVGPGLRKRSAAERAGSGDMFGDEDLMDLDEGVGGVGGDGRANSSGVSRSRGLRRVYRPSAR